MSSPIILNCLWSIDRRDSKNFSLPQKQGQETAKGQQLDPLHAKWKLSRNIWLVFIPRSQDNELIFILPFVQSFWILIKSVMQRKYISHVGNRLHLESRVEIVIDMIRPKHWPQLLIGQWYSLEIRHQFHLRSLGKNLLH